MCEIVRVIEVVSWMCLRLMYAAVTVQWPKRK